MHRFISTIAMTACFLVLVSGLWQDWGLMTTLKRMVIGYLGFFIMGSLMVLSVRFAGLYEGKTTEPVDAKNKPGKPEMSE